MDRFVSRFKSHLTGILSGFDRLVFRGSLIPLIRERGMYTFLLRAGVRLLDFKTFVLKTSEAVKEAALGEARKHNRPIAILSRATSARRTLHASCSPRIPSTRGSFVR